MNGGNGKERDCSVLFYTIAPSLPPPPHPRPPLSLLEKRCKQVIDFWASPAPAWRTDQKVFHPKQLVGHGHALSVVRDSHTYSE